MMVINSLIQYPLTVGRILGATVLQREFFFLRKLIKKTAQVYLLKQEF